MFKFNPEIVTRAESAKNNFKYVNFLTSLMFSLSCIADLHRSQKLLQLTMLPSNFGISSFGNLTCAFADLDDVKELFMDY